MNEAVTKMDREVARGLLPEDVAAFLREIPEDAMLYELTRRIELKNRALQKMSDTLEELRVEL